MTERREVEVNLPDPRELAWNIGVEHGRDAAAWYVQDSIGGRVSARDAIRTASRVLRGIEDGDPEILDSLPYPDLSGEWADGYTPRDLLHDVGGNDGDASFWQDLVSDLCDSYEDGFQSGVLVDVSEACREVLS